MVRHLIRKSTNPRIPHTPHPETSHTSHLPRASTSLPSSVHYSYRPSFTAGYFKYRSQATTDMEIKAGEQRRQRSQWRGVTSVCSSIYRSIAVVNPQRFEFVVVTIVADVSSSLAAVSPVRYFSLSRTITLFCFCRIVQSLVRPRSHSLSKQV